VDPPFAAVRDGSAISALAALMRSNAIASHALVVLEVPSDHAIPDVPGLDRHAVRDYGDTRLVFLRPPEPGLDSVKDVGV